MEENVKIQLDEKGRNLENPMGYAKVFPLIIKMSLPSMFAMLISALYNIVDSIYVARLSETALSAVSLVYPIQLLNIAVSVGTGVGLSSLISRRLGEKRLDDAENAVNHGLVLANLESPVPPFLYPSFKMPSNNVLFSSEERFLSPIFASISLLKSS